MAHQYRFSETSAPEDWQEWVAWLKPAMHSRTRWRLPLVLLGLLFARGRRTVTSWLRALGITTEYYEYYYLLASLGRKIEPLASALLSQLLKRLPIGESVTLALDDSPTARYGPKVEGAGLHRNPTSGPDDHKFVYGHVWVTLALILRHPLWNTIGLPLRALLYIKQKDLPQLAKRRKWRFRTKLELGGELVTWAVKLLQTAGKKRVRVVMDGAYACRPLFRVLLPLGVTIISRLRKDAGLCTLPKPRRPGQIGGTRRYGAEKISLAKRAAHRRGWSTVEVNVYGKTETKTYKTFLATWRPIGGVIRVVIVREKDDWQPFFSSDPNATVTEILECFADRSAIENVFHDVKEVWGAGQQQVRNVFTNVACYHLNLWMMTLVEAWAWHKPADEIRDRTACPWDNADRRPSHANRRKALARQILQRELSAPHVLHVITKPIRKLLDTLASLAT